MRSALLAASPLVVVTAFVAVFAAPAPDPKPPVEPVTCTIRAEPTCEVGKSPRVTVSLTNRTDSDIYLVGSLDGSDCGMRFPRCSFTVIGPDGKSAVGGIARCGNMNPLRPADFVKVPAGKSFSPFQAIDDAGFFSAHQLSPTNFRKPGEYRIRFIYSTKADNIADWAGDGRDRAAKDETLLGLLGKVPKVEVRSEEITVTVVEPAK